MTELNPENLTTIAMREQWYKLLAIVLWKHRAELPKEVIITEKDIEGINKAFAGMPVVLAHTRADGIFLKVIDEAEGRRLAKEVRPSN